MNYLSNFLEEHQKKVKENEAILSNFKIPANIMQLTFKNCASFEDFAETFEQLREFMNDKLSSYHPQALTIIQTLFGLFIIVNKKYQFQIDQLDVKTIKLSHTKNNKNIVKFESEACSKEGTKYIRKIA